MSDQLQATLEWKLVAADEWEYTNTLLLKPIAKVRYLERNERESKNFKWEAAIDVRRQGVDTILSYYFRTVAGAKRFVENYCIQKGKVE